MPEPGAPGRDQPTVPPLPPPPLQAERKPVALANTALSVSNWKEAIRVPQALGLDPNAANIASSVAAVAPLPHGMAKSLLGGMLSLGRTVAAAPLGPLDTFRQAQIKKILDSGESLRLQFPREDLGFVYEQGAVCTEPGDPHLDPGSSSAAGATRRGLPYIPTISPGE